MRQDLQGMECSKLLTEVGIWNILILKMGFVRSLLVGVHAWDIFIWILWSIKITQMLNFELTGNLTSHGVLLPENLCIVRKTKQNKRKNKGNTALMISTSNYQLYCLLANVMHIIVKCIVYPGPNRLLYFRKVIQSTFVVCWWQW